MKIRGIYQIKQIDRTLREDEVRLVAEQEIAAQIVETVSTELSTYIVKEEPSPKYPFGRYYLDLDITPTEF
jgi:hypothetical protein